MVRIIYPPEAIVIQIIYGNDIVTTHFCGAHKICSYRLIDGKTHHFCTIQLIGFVHVKSEIKLHP